MKFWLVVIFLYQYMIQVKIVADQLRLSGALFVALFVSLLPLQVTIQE